MPLGSASQPEPADGNESGEAENEGNDYSSLLAMKNPFIQQQEFVRPEEPDQGDGAFEAAVMLPAPAPVQSARRPADLASRPFDPPKNAPKSAVSTAVPAASRDPGEAERNLRAALATLQRMSGAA